MVACSIIWHLSSLVLLTYAYARPLIIKDESALPDKMVLYLKEFGYLPRTNTSSHDKTVIKAVSLVLEDLDLLPDLGPLELNSVLEAPCCGKSESIQESISNRRHKRFVPHRNKWRFTDITWKIRDPFAMFKYRADYDIVREVLTEAFRLWAEASDNILRMTDLSDQNSDADIDIFFALGDHGDHEPFDGTGGIVAHTGYPAEGKMHFDAAEFWTLYSETGIDFRYVALHEVGHALGLRHSRHNSSIMYPIYRRSGPHGDLGLHKDDVRGIRYLYPIPFTRDSDGLGGYPETDFTMKKDKFLHGNNSPFLTN